MAFSLRRMFSNINYFKKPDDFETSSNEVDDRRSTHRMFISDNVNFERTEADSTSKQYANSLKLPQTVKKFAAKQGSLSDTDTLIINVDSPKSKKEKRKNRKLKIDIGKAHQSMTEALDHSDNEDALNNVENTPKHILLNCQSSDMFRERLKNFDFDKSFDIYDELSDEQPPSSCDEENIDVESISDHSDISLESDTEIKTQIKMCRKVSETLTTIEDHHLIQSASPESFGDVELDKNEEERLALLLNYQMRFEKLECLLNKLLTEFQFHIDVSKVLHCRSVVTPLLGTDVTNNSKVVGEFKYVDNSNNENRGISPSGSWNVVIEKEDVQMKSKLKRQLLSIKQTVEKFINTHFQQKSTHFENKTVTTEKALNDLKLTTCYPQQKHLRINNKKKTKHFDFPDLRVAMTNLFLPDLENDDLILTSTVLSDYDSESSKCVCRCHNGSPSQSDSGLTSKTDDRSISNQSITSSIGNFTLDSTTLSAYSESLDQVVSYNSFQDDSLYTTLLQKPTIERIIFYVQVHSIQINCEKIEHEFGPKNAITFFCPACSCTENKEDSLLKHILSQVHCEKIHFLYKTAYIKKCVSSGKEIQPSTVLNPMKMYRDDNKIVCFGDTMYACSLCFENLIVGESVLMAHCCDLEHVDRRERLHEIFE